MDRYTEIIDHLQGTCNFLNDEDLDWMYAQDECFKFDDEIFHCHICGWWCEISELAANEEFEQNCNDCERDI